MNRDILLQLLDLFGSIPNAYRHLGPIMPWDRFRRALLHYYVTQEETDLIEDAWRTYCSTFIVPRYRHTRRWFTLDPTYEFNLREATDHDD